MGSGATGSMPSYFKTVKNKRFGLTALTGIILFFTYSDNLYAYEHPGAMHPKDQIEYVKKQIDLKNEPFVSAYNLLLMEADSALLLNDHALADFNIPGFYINPQDHRKNSLAIQTDGFSAYACALAWQLSGQKKYAEKALYFLNAWSLINTRYSNNDGPLVMTYSGASLVIAAELMRPYKKWHDKDKQRFKQWINVVYRKACNEIRKRKNNWGDWGRYGSMLADYYLDDDTDMAANIQLIKSDLSEKIGPDGHMVEEVKREANGIWYSYFSLAPITASCWLAFNATGENLFTTEKEGGLIKKAVDYVFYYNQHPDEWKWFKNPVTATQNSATGFWPANLIEAMSGVYKESSYRSYVALYQPVIYKKHHFAWTFPTMMPLNIDDH